LDLRKWKWREDGEDYKIKSFITCTLHQIIRVIKLRKMIMAGHIARRIEMRNVYKILGRNLKGIDHLEDQASMGGRYFR
jgi:hypothetical protein